VSFCELVAPGGGWPRVLGWVLFGGFSASSLLRSFFLESSTSLVATDPHRVHRGSYRYSPFSLSVFLKLF